MMFRKKQNSRHKRKQSSTMGGTPSKRKGADEYLAMECVAKYMSITKQQIIDLRNRCYMSMDSKRKINRRSFNNNVKLCKIKESPDGEILDCLFTMWDLQVDESILVPPFILSLAPLACRNEDFKNILTFSLSVFERETEGELSAEQVVFILKHMNQTASYFGDAALSHRQIYKIVDNVFGTVSVVSHEGPKLTHEQVTDELSSEPLLQQFVTKNVDKTPRVTFSQVSQVICEDGSEVSIDTVSLPLTPVARLRLAGTAAPAKSSIKTGSKMQDMASRQLTRSSFNARRH